VVAAQVQLPGRGQGQVEFGDGVLTGRGTFQKFYQQGELQAYLETQLGTEAVAAALGVFYVFRDEALRQQFLANRYRRSAAAPRKRLSEVRFEEHRDILEPFMAVIAGLLGLLRKEYRAADIPSWPKPLSALRSIHRQSAPCRVGNSRVFQPLAVRHLGLSPANHRASRARLRSTALG